MTSKTRICVCCLEEKSLPEFNRNAMSPGGYVEICKECESDLNNVRIWSLSKARVSSFSRRAQMYRVTDTLTKIEMFHFMATTERVCHWCGRRIKDSFDVDHIIPMSRGGENSITNLVLSCQTCNRSRKDGHRDWDSVIKKTPPKKSVPNDTSNPENGHTLYIPRGRGNETIFHKSHEFVYEGKSIYTFSTGGTDYLIAIERINSRWHVTDTNGQYTMVKTRVAAFDVAIEWHDRASAEARWGKRRNR